MNQVKESSQNKSNIPAKEIVMRFVLKHIYWKKKWIANKAKGNI